MFVLKTIREFSNPNNRFFAGYTLPSQGEEYAVIGDINVAKKYESRKIAEQDAKKISR